jgi:hypothetical protein
LASVCRAFACAVVAFLDDDDVDAVLPAFAWFAFAWFTFAWFTFVWFAFRRFDAVRV